MAEGPKRRRKLGEVTAARIIGDMVSQGWCEGEMLGNEQELMRRYGISRATFREAVRQLEWHGAACMVRGANGGLMIKARPRTAVIAATRSYFILTQVTQAEKRYVARILRDPPRADQQRRPNEALAVFREVLDDAPAAQDSGPSPVTGLPKLSATVARQIVLDVRSAGLKRGDLVGSAAELQRRYNVSRAVLREALRPLELHDIVRARTGAQGGVFVHDSDPDYTIELASAYLGQAQIPLSHVWEAQSSLAIAATGLVGKDRTAAPDRALQRAWKSLEDADPGNYFSAAFDFHFRLAELSGNRVLVVLIGIMLRFGLAKLPALYLADLPTLKAQHLRLMNAIFAGDGHEASSLISAMFDRSRRWILSVEASPEGAGH